MSYHHAAEAGGHVVGKRSQVDFAQCFRRVVDGREGLVAVGACVTVAREMLGYGEHSSCFEAARISGAEAAHQLGILAEGTASDHGIVGA